MKTAVILTFLFASVLAVSARGSLLDSLLQQMQAKQQEDYDKLEESALVQAEHSEEELLAQAMCQFSASTELKGRVYAVGRACNGISKTCEEICQDPQLITQDRQTATNTDWYCVGAYHVYKGRPNTNLNGDVGTAKLGLKSLKLRCDKPACGPNFCCCFGGIPS